MLKRFLMVLLIFVIITLSFGVYLYIDNNTIELTQYTIYSTKLPNEFKGYRIALLADFHDSYYYDKVVEKVIEARPDVIFTAGDMINIKNDSFDNNNELMKRLLEIAPVYAIQGNHEACHKNNKEFKSKMKEIGVELLDNKKVELTKGGEKINLYGMYDPVVNDSQLDSSEFLKTLIKKAKDSLDNDRFSMLLMHRANLFDYLTDCEYELIMAGHIHGGLIRLPFIGGIISSDNLWFPKYTKGIYTRKNSKMVVSRGLDYDLNKIRVFNGPEVVLITLDR